MTRLLSLSLFWIVLAAASPASAQMCGSGQAGATAAGTGMCGGMMGQRAAEDPMADKPAQPQQRAGMCGCCRNMAMMRGGQGGHSMPGMEMPKPQ